MVKEFNTYLISVKEKVYTFNKTDKSQISPVNVDNSKDNKNDTVDKADKSRSITVTNIFNKSTQVEKPSETFSLSL